MRLHSVRVAVYRVFKDKISKLESSTLLKWSCTRASIIGPALPNCSLTCTKSSEYTTVCWNWTKTCQSRWHDNSSRGCNNTACNDLSYIVLRWFVLMLQGPNVKAICVADTINLTFKWMTVEDHFWAIHNCLWLDESVGHLPCSSQM